MNQISNHNASNGHCKERIRRYVIGVPILLGVYLALILFYIYPHWPIDLIGWSILILAGIPISLGLEWIGESTFSEKAGLRISNKKFSAKRIGFSIFIFILIMVILGLLWFIFSSFVRQHFA